MKLPITAPLPPFYCTRRAARAVGYGCAALVCALSCLVGGAARAQTPSAPPPPVTAVVAPAVIPPTYHDPLSGVDIVTTTDPHMFPAVWRAEPTQVSAKPLAASEGERAVRVVKVALSKYSTELLKLNLSRVYVVGDLRFQGITAAGTNSSDRLYIKIESGNPLYTDTFIEESVHHEIAHLLQRNYGYLWDDLAWGKCNPPNFHYAAPSGVEAVREGHSSLRPNDDWNRHGFLSEYSASDPSEDFATVCGGLLTGDPTFWPLIDRFPALKTKLQTAINFYVKLNSDWTETFFRALRPGVTYAAPPESDVSRPTASVSTPAVASPTPPDPAGPAAKP